jgi:hypothetical protein
VVMQGDLEIQGERTFRYPTATWDADDSGQAVRESRQPSPSMACSIMVASHCIGQGTI